MAATARFWHALLTQEKRWLQQKKDLPILHMPRLSRRHEYLRDLIAIIKKRQDYAMLRYLMNLECPWEDLYDEILAFHCREIENQRYIFRAPMYRNRAGLWEYYLLDCANVNENEFLSHFRVSRAAFFRILELIRDDPIFEHSGIRSLRGGTELHLLIVLKFLGNFGNDCSASKLALFFGVGHGTIQNHLERAIRAVLNLRNHAFTWPDAAERKEISARMLEKYGFPNCVGIIDGTLLPLEFRPGQELDGEDWYTRKGTYAMHCLLVCDDLARVRNIHVGWPGSCHDNRIWVMTDLHRTRDAFFSVGEYLLGDSAFRASAIMIPAFKKPARGQLEQPKVKFNKMLAKARIKVEHCIGLIKARWQYLKGIRVKLKRKRDARRTVRYVTAAITLHNLMVLEPVPSNWRIEPEEGGLGHDDELNLPANAEGDQRRNQLLAYILEAPEE